MNWTVNNVYQYRDKPLRAPDGIRWRWYTDSTGHMILRQDMEFGLMIVDTRELMELLAELNHRQLEPQ